MNKRKAECACGHLSLTVEGEPLRVHICHCDYCQKRTGSVFQVSCWYRQDKVTVTGEYSSFNGSANSIGVDYRFCPNCGSTVFWTFENVVDFPSKDLFGIAVGCFSDPGFPKPESELCIGYRHHWVPVLEELPQYEGFPPRELVAKAVSH